MLKFKAILRFKAVGAAIVVAIGCAHSSPPDPYVYTLIEAVGTTGGPPSCFTRPLENCVDASPRTNAELFPSRWRYPFRPDLFARVCRGDEDARLRFLNGVHHIDDGSGSNQLVRVYLGLLDGCSSPGFCGWALDIAADSAETQTTRNLFMEAAKRGCESVLPEDQLERVAAELGRALADEPRWTTNSQDVQCAALPKVEQPWDDLATRRAAGCLNLVDWIEDHRDDPEGTAGALERCVNGREIRYREADCLRELAGLDRNRAVALLRDDERRGWGMSSTINRYATTLLRFPEEGQLETELTSIGLLAAPPPPPVEGERAVILTSEILERNGRLLRFNPSCPARYCEHAPLAYQLVDLISPTLDDLMIEERWPSLEEVPMGSGDRAVSTTVDGISVNYFVDEDATGGIDGDQVDRLREGARQALAEPHELIVYAKGAAFRIGLRNLGDWYDLEALIGGLNSILAARKSDFRYVALAPHCIPCANIVAGPSDGLIDAAFAGLIEVVDPFNELWTQPSFDAESITRHK